MLKFEVGFIFEFEIIWFMFWICIIMWSSLVLIFVG